MCEERFLYNFPQCGFKIQNQKYSVFINKRISFEISIPLQENLPYFPPLAGPIDIIKHKPLISED